VDTKQQEFAKDSLFAAYPEIEQELLQGLPPQLLYYSQVDDYIYVVHTLEGSGVEQIFAANCYRIDNTGEVAKVGEYVYQPYMSYILQDINNLDQTNCKIN
jgi:hypothetical protein